MLDGFFSLAGLDAAIGAVFLKSPRLLIVAEVCFQNIVAQARPQSGIEDRDKHFNAPIKVTGHDVGAADIEAAFPIGVEPVDAGVLQETPDDGRHLDVVADAPSRRGRQQMPRT